MLIRIARRLKRRLLKKLVREAQPKPVSHYDVEEEVLSSSNELIEEEDKFPDLEINRAQLEEFQKQGGFILIDIREIFEMRQGYLEGAWLVPMREIPTLCSSFPTDQDLVIYCAAGIRSYDVAYYLREQGFTRAWSLEGGVGTWADQGYLFPPTEGGLQLMMEVSTERGKARVHYLQEQHIQLHYFEEGMVFSELFPASELKI